MVKAKTDFDKTASEEMIAEFGDILRRKKRTVRHIEQAIARYYERQAETIEYESIYDNRHNLPARMEEINQG